jgi:hypothetical protein
LALVDVRREGGPGCREEGNGEELELHAGGLADSVAGEVYYNKQLSSRALKATLLDNLSFNGRSMGSYGHICTQYWTAHNG